jgi:hypothetical protein
MGSYELEGQMFEVFVRKITRTDKNSKELAEE